MFGEKLCIQGKRGFQKLLRAIQKKTRNVNETGVSWQALPDCGFRKKEKSVTAVIRVRNG